MIEFPGNIGVVLSIVFTLLTAIYLLVLFILMLRFFKQTKEQIQKNFIRRWEERIFVYLATEEQPVKVLIHFNRYSYKYLLLFLRNYILALKGKDKDKLLHLINDTELYDYLITQLNSAIKRKLIFGAYFLGLAQSKKAIGELRKKMKSRNEFVFVSCAISLAKIDAEETLDDIFAEAHKFERLSLHTFQSILLEFNDSICVPLLKRLNIKTSDELKPMIISTLRYFKYFPPSPDTLLKMLNDENDKIVIELLKYFGEIEYIDASDKIKIHLQNPNPEIKVEAIKAIKKIGDTNLERNIWDLLYDDNHNVKVTAAEAMYDFSDESREKLESIEYSSPDTLESSIARMIIEERAVQLY